MCLAGVLAVLCVMFGHRTGGRVLLYDGSFCAGHWSRQRNDAFPLFVPIPTKYGRVENDHRPPGAANHLWAPCISERVLASEVKLDTIVLLDIVGPATGCKQYVQVI